MKYKIEGLLFASLLFGSLFSPFGAQAETIDQNTAKATNLGIYGGEVRDVAFDTTNGIMYITTYSPNGFFYSSDDGATWTVLDPQYDLGEPRGVEVDDSGNVFLLISDGLFVSTDHGVTFTETGDIGQFGSTFIINNGRIIVGRTDGSVAVSEDSGATFTTTTVEEDSNVNSVSAFTSTDDIYAVLDDNTDSSLYYSADGGTTWNIMDITGIDDRFTLVAMDPTDPNHIIVLPYNESDSPWQTNDAGTTWTTITGTSYAAVVTFDADGRIYLGTSYSDDFGTSWQTLNETTPGSRVNGYVWPDPANVNRLVGASFAAVALSVDKGINWTDSNTGITAVTVYEMAQSTDKNTVWAATSGGLAMTTDFLSETATWVYPINYDYYPQSVWVSPDDANDVVVGGMGAMYVTSDGGTSWTTATGWNSDFTAYQIASDPTDSSILFASAGIQSLEDNREGGVFTSTDGGLTWSSLDITADVPTQTLAVSTEGTVYAGAGLIGIRGNGTKGLYTYSGGSWTKLTGAPNDEVTSVIIDRGDQNTLYLTASDFDSNQNDDGGVYKSTDAGVTWTQLTGGLDTASKYRVITQQRSGTTLYMAGTDTETGAGTVWKSTDGGTTWGVVYAGLQNETFQYLLFDGLMAGNSRGAYDLKSKAKVVIKSDKAKVAKGNEALVKVTLKDAATLKLLKDRKVKLMKKKDGVWTVIDTARTNNKGVATFNVTINKKTQLKAKYVPKGNAADEYVKSISTRLVIKLK